MFSALSGFIHLPDLKENHLCKVYFSDFAPALPQVSGLYPVCLSLSAVHQCGGLQGRNSKGNDRVLLVVESSRFLPLLLLLLLLDLPRRRVILLSRPVPSCASCWWVNNLNCTRVCFCFASASWLVSRLSILVAGGHRCNGCRGALNAMIDPCLYNPKSCSCCCFCSCSSYSH